MGPQGYEIRKNIIYQDNKSTILLEKNGTRSLSNRTRAIKIRYLFLNEHIQKGNLTAEYFPNTEMIYDFMSKQLQGKFFQKFRKMIMGHMDVLPQYLEQHDCVGRLNNLKTDHRKTPKTTNILYTHLCLI